jgi:hypothetical protein
MFGHQNVLGSSEATDKNDPKFETGELGMIFDGVDDYI